ncbi:MAG: winged helix-turn-helix transcriptional regulator [Halolamina sp.]
MTRCGPHQRPNWAVPVELRQDARDISASDIGEKRDLSPGTIRRRLNKLEESGTVREYHIDIDYELARYPLCSKIICTAPVSDRDDFAKQVRDINGVTVVRELMTGKRDV